MSDDVPITEAETVVCCRGCGGDLPASARDGLCTACARQALFDATLVGETTPRFAAPTVRQLDRWLPSCEVLEVVGAGGMGYVYKARQVALDRIVAIKVLPVPGAATGGGGNLLAERFLIEARAMARLSHPNIVAIHDFGSTGDGYFYFIMEYVDGVGLDAYVRVARPSVLDALRLVVPICDALAYAHGQGIVHRDIKPANILVGAGGRVKVADFGIASLVGAEVGGPVFGTPGFMAPETRGAGGEIDGRADLYSLGVLVYEMMTGEMPGPRRASVAAAGGVSVRLDIFLARALAEDPARRFSSAAEMGAALDDVIRHQELMTGGALASGRESGGSGVARFAARWAGRLAWLCVLVLICAGVWFILPVWRQRKASSAPVPAETAAAFRRFTNRSGKVLEGEAVSHFGDSIRIRDRAGKVWRVPVATLSGGDQEWVRQWQTRHAPVPGAGDLALTARRPFGTGLQRVPEAGYEIVIRNTTSANVSGLVVETRVFLENEGLRRVDGRLPVETLPAGATRVLKTGAIALPRPRNGKSPARAKVLGLWSRVFAGGEWIAEDRDPALGEIEWDAGTAR